jgi:pimeloyl-ACP methyl ester carboxylesterase
MNTTNIRGNRLWYVDLNKEQKEAILLVHGHPFDHSMWEYQYDVLKDFRIINPDLFGYGKSEPGFDKIYIEQQALDLALLLDQLEIESVHLIGLSMGGQIIIEFARLFPHRTKSLVICASTPYAENDSSYAKRIANAQEIAEIGMTEHTKKTIQNYINTKVHASESPVYKHLYKMMCNTPKNGAMAAHKGRAERRDNFDFLKKIDVPTLFIAGELDYFFDVSTIQRIANEVKHSRTVVIEGSGHLPNMEQPEAFNLNLEKFYSSIKATSYTDD